MSASLRPMTAAAFLEWEEKQEQRYEFDGVTVEAMVGGTAGHARIQANLAGWLVPALGDGRCQFFGADIKLSVGRSFRYPDAMVVCAPVPRTARFVTNPIVTFEVLSDSTKTVDLTVKYREYRSIPTLRRYVVVEQDHIAARVFVHDGDIWREDRLEGPDAVLLLPDIGVEGIELGRLYRGVFDEGH